MFGLLLPDTRLLDVGTVEPSAIYEEEGAQHLGTVVPVDFIELSREQLEAGVPMGYDAQRRVAVLHPVLGPARDTLAAEARQAAADLAVERPQLRALLAQALTALVADEVQRAAAETQRASDATALAAATTLAQTKPILTRMLAREQAELAREQLRIRLDERMLRALAGQLGIPAPAQGLR